MLTLKQLNLSEEELGQFLNYIYEAEDHPEKDLYAQFIDEATLDHKLGLLVAEARKMESLEEIKDTTKQGHLAKGVASVAGVVAGLGIFWVAYRGIRAAFDKCSRKCSAGGLNTFMRQQCMAKCKIGEMASAVGAANKINCPPGDAKCPEKKKAMIQKYQTKLAAAKNKSQRYDEKHKKLRYTV